MSEAKLDLVNNPPHYTAGEIECKDAIKSALVSCTDGYTASCLGHVIKYVWRFKLKGNPIQDLEKSVFWLNEALDRQKEIAEKYRVYRPSNSHEPKKSNEG